MPEQPPELQISYMDPARAGIMYGEAACNGEEVFRSIGLHYIDHLIVAEDGITHTRHEFPYFSEPVVITKGLQIAGILRRAHLFGPLNLVEEPIQRGDHVSVANSEGEEFTRMKVKKDLGASLRSEAKRLGGDAEI
ncbi:MAG TPA: hypothetical protein VJR27_02160 [Candidatus Saccharimonadales bacterium]|nr:hypothetical protein [Candidatus Saccharimonadales bacterium]